MVGSGARDRTEGGFRGVARRWWSEPRAYGAECRVLCTHQRGFSQALPKTNWSSTVHINAHAQHAVTHPPPFPPVLFPDFTTRYIGRLRLTYVSLDGVRAGRRKNSQTLTARAARAMACELRALAPCPGHPKIVPNQWFRYWPHDATPATCQFRRTAWRKTCNGIAMEMRIKRNSSWDAETTHRKAGTTGRPPWQVGASVCKTLGVEFKDEFPYRSPLVLVDYLVDRVFFDEALPGREVVHERKTGITNGRWGVYHVAQFPLPLTNVTFTFRPSRFNGYFNGTAEQELYRRVVQVGNRKKSCENVQAKLYNRTELQSSTRRRLRL